MIRLLTSLWFILSCIRFWKISQDWNVAERNQQRLQSSVDRSPKATIETFCDQKNTEDRCHFRLKWRSHGTWTSVCASQRPSSLIQPRYWRLEKKCSIPVPFMGDISSVRTLTFFR